MARPRKEGMDYFPHDVHAAADEKLEAMLMLHGAKGYAFFFLHLEYIYRRDELSVDVSGKIFRRVMCAKMRIDEDEYDAILQTALECGLFDEERYNETGELTSEGVRKRAGVVFDEREKDRERKNRAGKLPENIGIDPFSEVEPEFSGSFPPENESIPELSGLKESKGKERKEVGAERSPAGDHSTPSEPTPEPYGIDIPLVDGTSYAVTKADVAQWEDAYPGVDVPAELKRIRSWADSNEKKRKTRKGIRKHINGWLSTEQDRGGRNERASPRPRSAEPCGKQIGGLTF